MLIFVQVLIISVQFLILIIPFNIGLKRNGIPWASGTQVAIALQFSAFYISLFFIFILFERNFENWEISIYKANNLGFSFYAFLAYIGLQIFTIIFLHCQKIKDDTVNLTTHNGGYRYSLPANMML